MGTKQFIRLLILTILSSLLLIWLFSPGFVGLKIVGGSIFESLLGLAAIAVVVFAIWFILQPQKHIITQQESIHNYIQSLSALSRNDVFMVNAKCLIEQVKRFDDKLDTVDQIILKKFDASEISYARFHQVLKATREVFYSGVQSVINRMIAFDEDDYRRITQGQAKISPALLETKMKLYREHLEFINITVEKNEEILVRLDRLLLESSKMSSLEVENLENMQAIKELDTLTDQAKQYK